MNAKDRIKGHTSVRSFRRYAALAGLAPLLLCPIPAFAQITANESATNAAMQAEIAGESIAISNLTVELGRARQNGTFSGGTAAIGIDSGIFISTGRGNNFSSAATVRSDVQNDGQSPDADLVAIRPGASRDTSAVSLQITPSKNTIFARFAFASEEYPEYVCSNFNDAFGLFISGGDLSGTQNIAVVPGSGSTISINSVNNGLNNDGQVCNGETTNNSEFYNDNPTGPNFIFDGFTDVFEVVIEGVTPGETYDFKMAVADAVDNIYDSAVFLEVFDSRWINDADLSLTLTSPIVTPVVGEPFTITATVTNDGPDEVEFFKVEDILPDGLTFAGVLSGGGYDTGADEWSSTGTLASGASQTITLRAIAYDTSTYATTAEIIEQFANDIDSTPANRASQPLEDDTATLTLGPVPDYFFTGRVFLDDGAGDGTAYDGLQNGSEAAVAGINVSLLLAADGSALAVVTTDGNGDYALPYDQALAGQAVTIRTAPDSTNYQITETPGALPGLVNPSSEDGEVTFTPAASTSYADIDFGQLGRPRLTEDRTVSVEQGSSVLVAHTYTAAGTGTVTFTLENLVSSAPGLFSSNFYRDTDCSGTINNGETLVSSAVSFDSGDIICLLAQHIVAASAPAGTTLTYGVQAVTGYTGFTLSNTLTNNDRVIVTPEGAAELLKQVCNTTTSACDVNTGSGFAATNTGQPGDTLQYRLTFIAKGADDLQNVNIFDNTPDFSSLSAGTAIVVQSPANMTCSVITPAGGGTEGYEGQLHWQCGTGAMSPGGQGIVAFQVRIDQQ